MRSTWVFLAFLPLAALGESDHDPGPGSAWAVRTPARSLPRFEAPSNLYEPYYAAGAQDIHTTYCLPLVLTNLELSDWLDPEAAGRVNLRTRNRVSLERIGSAIEVPEWRDFRRDASPPRRVLSIGESFGEFLPFLVSRSVNANALDPLYERVRENHPYRRLLGQQARFYAGYGGQMDQVPGIGKFHLIVGHALMGNVPAEDRAALVKDAFDHLEPGGQIRLEFGDGDSEEAVRTARQWMKDLPPGAYSAEVVEKHVSVDAESAGAHVCRFSKKVHTLILKKNS